MYKTAVMTTTYTGTMSKNRDKYEGTWMSLMTQDPAYGGPPPYGNLPDVMAGMSPMELVDCNTIKHTVPFMGLYLGPLMWAPGTPWTGIDWKTGATVPKPLGTAPNVDMLLILTGDTKPVVETYRRLPSMVNPDLLPK